MNLNGIKDTTVGFGDGMVVDPLFSGASKPPIVLDVTRSWKHPIKLGMVRSGFSEPILNGQNHQLYRLAVFKGVQTHLRPL